MNNIKGKKQKSPGKTGGSLLLYQIITYLTLNSTRLLAARPSLVELSATGLASP